MKLIQHREDVKYILNTLPRPLGSKRPQEIAKRLSHLIDLVEEAERLYYQGIYTTKAKQVLKDAEVKK